MRTLSWFAFALSAAIGTGCNTHSSPLAAAPPVASATVSAVAPDEPAAADVAAIPAGEIPQEVPNSQLSSTPAEAADVPSLWTRKTGYDWPVFLGPSGNSKSAETGIQTEWPAEGLKLVWHKKLGTSYGAPTISRGRLFQFDRFGDNARLYCLNAETGEPIWQREYATDYEDMYGYNNGPRCSPVIDGDRVYAYGVDGMLFCCRATDGHELWRADTAKEYGVIQNFFGVGSTPVVEGDLLILMVGGSPPDSQRVPRGQLDRVEPSGSGIVALDKMTGAFKYKLADELASYSSLKLATIAGRRWCFAFCRGGLIGFDPSTGKLDFHYLWRDANLESVNASMPVVAGDLVFISETYGPGSSLLKVAPGKHEVVWRDDLRKRDKAMQTHWNTPVYLDGYLYGSSGRHEYNAELRCIDLRTGKVQWSESGLYRSSLMYIDGHFLCMSEDGTLRLLKANPQKFEETAATKFGDPDLGLKLIGQERPVLVPPCWAAPVVSHGLLYLRGNDRLICLELIREA